MTPKEEKKSRAPWTKKDMKALNDAVKAAKAEGKSLSSAFAIIAEQRGSKPSSVMAKFYAMNPVGKGNAVKTPKVSGKARKGRVAPTSPSTKKSVSTPAADFRSTVLASLTALSTPREFCPECETPFVGEHTVTECRNNLRQQVTLMRTEIASSIPTNGKVPTFA